MSVEVMLWNRDKKHRCPNCHAVTITMEKPQEKTLYTCCKCSMQFSSDPGHETRVVGLMCEECLGLA